MQLCDEYSEKAKITLNLHNRASFPFIKGDLSVSRGGQSNALVEKFDLQIKAYSGRNKENVTDERGGHHRKFSKHNKCTEELTKQQP